MTSTDRALNGAYAPVYDLPTVYNVSGTTAAIAIPDRAVAGADGPGGPSRRVHVQNTGAVAAGVVWAYRADTSATKITGQTMSTATQIPAGTALELLISDRISIGYVGNGATLSITISEN